MIPRQSISHTKRWLWCLIIACGLVAVYLGFVSLFSLWMGIMNTHKAGFWIPILVGATFLIAVFWTFLRITRHLLSQMKEEDVVNI